MYDDMHDNQRAAPCKGFIGAAIMHMDAKSGECLLVSGSAASIKLLGS